MRVQLLALRTPVFLASFRSSGGSSPPMPAQASTGCIHESGGKVKALQLKVPVSPPNGGGIPALPPPQPLGDMMKWFLRFQHRHGFCRHRSHRLNLPCWRWFTYDGFCAKHNNTCWNTHVWEEA